MNIVEFQFQALHYQKKIDLLLVVHNNFQHSESSAKGMYAILCNVYIYGKCPTDVNQIT